MSATAPLPDSTCHNPNALVARERPMPATAPLPQLTLKAILPGLAP